MASAAVATVTTPVTPIEVKVAVDVVDGRCWLIPESGTPVSVPDSKEKDGFTTKQLQAFVNGSIEGVMLTKNIVMIVNDEGLMTCNHNPHASFLYAKYVNKTGFIHGPVFVCPAKMAGYEQEDDDDE